VREGLWKTEGAGNDFILALGARAEKLAADTEWIRALCSRRRGIGADGFLALIPRSGKRLQLIYRNADASPARFCANGTRVAARAATQLLGLNGLLEIETGWKMIPAETRPDAVILHLPPPETQARRICPMVEGAAIEGNFLVFGVPHFLVDLPDEGALSDGEIPVIARSLRSHPAFGKGGANVSFLAPTPAGALRIRSFERGVPEEVLSCGSAMAAAGWIHGGNRQPVELLPLSGDTLQVSPGSSDRPIRLEGPARIIARIEDFSSVEDP